MIRINGPFERSDRKSKSYRLKVTDRETKRAWTHSYPTREEALAAIPKLRREYRRPVGVTVKEALDAYQAHLATRGGRPGRPRPNRPRTITTAMERLGGVFSDPDTITGELTAPKVVGLWQAWVQGKATDTALNTLAQVRRFLTWLESKAWVPGPLKVDVEVVGERRKGKPKLTRDEASKLFAWCLERPKDPGAIATAMALMLGMRASEITDRLVKDVDAAGTLLDITSAKTDAGIRTLRLPAKLQPLVAGLALGKAPTDRLFGDANRHWLLREVVRCCKAAGVSQVTPHGLRGTHAKMSREVGMSGVLLAQAMGHESESTTTEHYAGRGAVAQANVDRVAESLN